jgi:hypothetical protein
MNVNKVLFVGLGGAGQRYLRIFKELLPEKTKFSAFQSQAKITPLLRQDFAITVSLMLISNQDPVPVMIKVLRVFLELS